MKLNLSTIVAFITLVIGLVINENILFPATFLVAGVIDLFTRNWAISDKLGEMVVFSQILKIVLLTIAFYGMVGIIVNIWFIVIWL